MRYYILTLITLLMVQSAYALDIVYPKQKEVTINSPSTFFVGNADTKVPLKINGQNITIHESGGFAYAVELNVGENQFVIESGEEKQIFKITRPNSKNLQTSDRPEILYGSARTFATIKDNVPLRSTPVDGGINRIAHYQEGVPVNVIGEKNGFYKIKLNEKQSAWIDINDVRSVENALPAKLLNRNIIEDESYYIFKIDFDKKVPYVIEGGYPFVVKFYGVEDKPDSTFTFTFPLKQKLIGYSGKYEGNSFVLKIRKFPEISSERPLKNVKIVVDAGHGGSEVGALGCLRDKEKDINLAIARNLASELRVRGAKVVMTRSGDDTVELYDRVDIANKNDAMIFISIHGNALPDNADPNKNSGTSIYYYYPQSKALADSIMKTMDAQLPLADDLVRKGSLAVVRNTNALSVLIEVGYLINPSDNAYLIDREIQQKAGKAIADGVEEFLKD